MNRVAKTTIVTLLLGLSLGACSKNRDNDRKPEKRNTDPSDRSIVADSAEVAKSKDAEACDTKNAGLIAEIAAALDKRKDEIQELEKNTPLSDSYDVVKVGPTYFYKLKKDLVAQPGWKQDKENWAKASELFAKVKDQPINQEWIQLNRKARSLVFDDRRRVLGKRNMTLGHADDDTLKDLRAGIENCIKEPNCNLPKTDAKIDAIIQKTPLYLKHVKALTSKAAHDEALLKAYAADVDVDIADRG
ncbi:MAG: hypothetical protein ABL958_19805, partial [Bdellovibrionia bacterium]